MRAKTVSLSRELNLVARALDGMRLLTQQWSDLHFAAEDLPRVALALHGTLVLVRERLVILDRCVRDTLDPRHVCCEENVALDQLPGDDGDVVLRSWSARKEARKLRREADRAAHRVEVLATRRRRRQEEAP